MLLEKSIGLHVIPLVGGYQSKRVKGILEQAIKLQVSLSAEISMKQESG